MPDGQHLALAWNGGSGPSFSTYVKLVGTEDLLRLTKRESSIDFDPVWSHDGRYIAFCRMLEGETGIYIVPALGGVERRMRETYWRKTSFNRSRSNQRPAVVMRSGCAGATGSGLVQVTHFNSNIRD